MTDAARLPTPLIVWALAAAMLGAYGLFSLAGAPTQANLFVAFALIPERFDPESPARFGSWIAALGALFGHAFLHAGWWHVGANAFFFFLGGRVVARRLGAWRFALLFLAATVGGGLSYIALNWGMQAVAVGASGAVCGVFAAYFLASRPSWREALSDRQIRRAMGVFLLINVVLMGFVSAAGIFPIAWEAHLGGFIAGGLAYIALAPRVRAGPWG